MGRSKLTGGKVKDYALFVGGYRFSDQGTYYAKEIDPIDENLTRISSPPTLPAGLGGECPATTTIGQYAIFMGQYGAAYDST